jgi:hypothetical protein
MNNIESQDNLNIYQIKIYRWRMAFFSLVILLAGIIIGASAALIVIRHMPMGPKPGPEHIADRMIFGLRHDLGLSPQQAEQIEPIIHRHMQKLDQIRMGARPMIAEELRQMNDEIMFLLDQRQKDLWEQLIRKLSPDFPPGQNPPLREPEGQVRPPHPPPKPPMPQNPD